MEFLLKQFDGLDAMMSIQMMPRGVPVLACGPRRWSLFVPFLKAVKTLVGYMDEKY